MEVVGGNTLLPGDPRLIDHIVCELKSQGIFDQFRKECIADVDTKPAYQNLRQRVEGSVTGFLKTQNWRPDMNKNQLREMLRKNIYESGFLETGVERIVDQVVNPKINTVFLPQVEEVVYKFLGLAKPSRNSTYNPSNGALSINTVDLLPTDLDPISPDSEVLDKSLNKSDKNTEVEAANLDDSKNDEFESPPFEPINEQTVYEPHDESSNDSRISGISGLTSHDSSDAPEKINIFGPDVNNQDSQLSKVSSNSRLSIVTTDSKHTPEKMDISDDNTEDSGPKIIEQNASLIGVENSQIKEDIRDELEQIRMEINGHNQNKDIAITEEIQDVVKMEIKEEITNNDVKMTLDDTSVVVHENITSKEEISVKEEISGKEEIPGKENHEKEEISPKEETVVKVEPEKQEIKVEETSKVEAKKSDRHRHDSEKRKDKHTDNNKDRKDDRKDDKKSSDKDKKDKYKSSSSSSSRDKDRHREKSRDNKSSKDKDGKSHDDKNNDKNKDKNKDKSKSSSSSSKHSSRDRNRSSSKSESKSSKDSRDHSKSKDSKSKSDDSKSKKSDSSKSRSRDHSKSDSSKHSSSHTSKDRSKSTSTSSSKDYKKDGKKSSNKREQDDHSSSRDKKTDSRRSADRDSNDGSSGVNNTSTSNSTKEKDSSTSTSSNKSKSDNSDFSGSNSGDSGQSDNFQSVKESTPPLKVDITLDEVALNPSHAQTSQNPQNPLQQMKLKKPKIASNIFEVRKLMKIRKKMEKLEKKRQRQHELAEENKNMRSNTESPNSIDDTDSVDSESLLSAPNNIDELVKNMASITGEDISQSENTTAIVSKESWDAIEAKLSQSAHENVDFNLYAEDTGDSSSNSKIEDSSSKRSKRMSEEEDCLYFSNEVSPTTERFLQSIETFQKNSLIDSPDLKSKRSKRINNTYDSEIYSDASPKKKTIKGKKRKLDGEIDSENNNKKLNAIGEITDVLDNLTASPSGSNLSNGSIEKPKSRPKKTKKTVNCSPSSDIDSENLGETKTIKYSRASILKNQRYSSDDLYKPRPVVSGSSRRQRGLLNNTDKKN